MPTASITSPKVGAARYAAFILLLGLLPNARADDCWIDRFGREHCRLSVGARVGIAVAVVVMILIILLALVLYRRRRIQQHNLSYINPQPNYAGGNPGGPPGGAQPGPYAAGYAPNYSRNSYGSPQPQYSQPQYPPQTLNGSGHGYEPNGGFAPPPGPPPAHIQQQDYPHVQQQDYPPPQYFPPPQGPPPEGKM